MNWWIILPNSRQYFVNFLFVILLVELKTICSTKLINRQYFLREPDNQTAVQGEQVTLPCRVQNKVGTLQWTRDGFGLGETRDLIAYSRYKLIGSDEEKDWTLQIKPVLLEDDAVFQCQVGATDEALPIRSRFAKVTVYVKPANPVILEGPVFSAREGEYSRLTCVSPGGKPAAHILWYDGDGNRIIDNIHLETVLLDDNKRFNSTSTLTFVPRKENHNQTFTCSASNVADRTPRSVTVNLSIEYSPSIQLTVSQDPVFEGDTISFACRAHSNPGVIRYSWLVDGQHVTGFNSDFFLIANISRVYHGSVVKCQVENKIGISEESITVNVLYTPRVRLNPSNKAGEDGETVTLSCHIDSNPPPIYTWTRGTSRQAVGSSQNLSVVVSRRTAGDYYCHGISEGFELVTTRPAKIMVKGPPIITSKTVQIGAEGKNVRVECSGISVPYTTAVAWSYMGKQIQEESRKFEILTSSTPNFGFKSTLLIRNAESMDFGYYGCSVTNRMGMDEQSILLEREDGISVVMVTTIVLASLAIVLLVISIFLYVRNSCCLVSGREHCEKSSKLNNIDSGTGQLMSEEKDDDLYNQRIQQNKQNQAPKPDLIATGYPGFNANSVQDYSTFPNSDSQTSLQSAGQLNSNTAAASNGQPPTSSSLNSHRQSTLLVTDPRFSAHYGNHYLRSPVPPSINHQGVGGAGGVAGAPSHYSTFSPHGSSSPIPQVASGPNRSNFLSGQQTPKLNSERIALDQFSTTERSLYDEYTSPASSRLGELTSTNLSLDTSTSSQPHISALDSTHQRIPGLDSSHPSHPPPLLSTSNQSSPLGMGRGQQQGNGHSYLPSMMNVTGGMHYRHPASSDIYAQVSRANPLIPSNGLYSDFSMGQNGIPTTSSNNGFSKMLSKPLFNGAARFSSANIMQQSADSQPYRQNKSPSGSPTPPPPPPFPTATSVASPLYVTVANSADLGTHV